MKRLLRNVAAGLALCVATVANAPAVEVFRYDFTTTDTDFHLEFLPVFNLDSPLFLQASLNDLEFVSEFSFLGMAVVKSGGLLQGSLRTPGQFSFKASEPGDYRVLLGYRGIEPGSAGTLSLVTAVPEPEIWLMFLLGGGLVGLVVWRKNKQLEVNRLAS